MRGEIPRSPRTLRKRERRPETEVRSTWWDKVLKTGPFVVSFTGLFISIATMLVTLTVNGPILLRNGKEFVKWYRTDQVLSGHWNNSGEYDIEAPAWSKSDDDALFLNINVYQGQISGTAVSQRLCKYSLHTDLFVEGRMAGNDGFVTLWDFIGGKRQAFAKAKLHVDRANGVLDVDVTEQAPDLFPKTFRLGKGSDYTSTEGDRDEPLDESEKTALKHAEKVDQERYQGSFCKDAIERVEQATKQSRK